MTCELPTVGQLHSLSEELICLVTPEIQPIHAITGIEPRQLELESESQKSAGVGIEPRQPELESESKKGLLDSESLKQIQTQVWPLQCVSAVGDNTVASRLLAASTSTLWISTNVTKDADSDC